MAKLSKEKITLAVGLVMLISIITLVIMLFSVRNGNQNSTIIANNNAENFDKYSCDESQSNVARTECTIEALDRASAEREWKQRKLETIKKFDISVDYTLMLPDLSTEQAKIRKWRENFESFRDQWCEAGGTFASGSGTPGGIATCKLELELKAIEDLNAIYYWTIVEVVGDDKAVSNFEPSDTDINLLVKTNKTIRGCVWAGENKCD